MAYHSHVGRYCHVGSDTEDAEKYSCLYVMQQSKVCLPSRMFLDYCTRSAEEPIFVVEEPHRD